MVIRVAEVGSHSSKAKMAMKIFGKPIFTIFATNAFVVDIFLVEDFQKVRKARQILISRQNSVC